MSEQRPKILVVDDDDDIVWMITAVLRKDYDVVGASDGAAALEQVGEGLHGVISDHMMPGMNGVELLDRVHALAPQAARILVTASDRVNVLRDAVNRARVHRFLSKPLRLTELPALLAGAIREARLEAENVRLVDELKERNRELAHANENLEAEVRERTAELSAAVEKLKQLALHDGLTGLYNHRYLQEQLDIELSRARRYGNAVGIIFIDVDHFKRYNDANGHPAGDRLLSRLATVLTGGGDSGLPMQTRRSDIIARYGGEEFVLVLPQTNLEGTAIKAERIRAAVAAYEFEFGGSQPAGYVSVSVGVAAFPEHGDSRQALLDAADRELYRAKSSGRDCVCIASSD